MHGYSVGMYYSMPVLIELLMQLTSNGKNSIYTNSALDDYEAVVPMALLHSLVIFGGLSLGAAKIRRVYVPWLEEKRTFSAGYFLLATRIKRWRAWFESALMRRLQPKRQTSTVYLSLSIAHCSWRMLLSASFFQLSYEYRLQSSTIHIDEYKTVLFYFSIP